MEKIFQQCMPILHKKSFIETKFSHSNDAKKYGMLFKNFIFRIIRQVFFLLKGGGADDIAEPKRFVAASSEICSFVKIACDYYHVTIVLSVVLLLNFH